MVCLTSNRKLCTWRRVVAATYRRPQARQTNLSSTIQIPHIFWFNGRLSTQKRRPNCPRVRSTRIPQNYIYSFETNSGRCSGTLGPLDIPSSACSYPYNTVGPASQPNSRAERTEPDAAMECAPYRTVRITAINHPAKGPPSISFCVRVHPELKKLHTYATKKILRSLRITYAKLTRTNVACMHATKEWTCTPRWAFDASYVLSCVRPHMPTSNACVPHRARVFWRE